MFVDAYEGLRQECTRVDLQHRIIAYDLYGYRLDQPGPVDLNLVHQVSKLWIACVTAV
jgi:hypothetical protein